MFHSSSCALLLLLPPTGLQLRVSATDLATRLDLNSIQPSVNTRSLLNFPGFRSFLSGWRNTRPTLQYENMMAIKSIAMAFREFKESPPFQSNMS